MADNNTVILRVQLDEGKTEDQLKQLTLDLEATRKAQAALTAERKAGTVTDADFAQNSVQLKTQLAGQRGEYAALEKNLSLYRKAQAGEADQYAATQAALSLSIRQQQQLAGSANNSSEASQALTAQIAKYRETLSQTDAQQGAFFRNVGNYPKGESLEPLIQRLIQLQEIEKQLPAGSAPAIAAQKEIGYQFGKVNEAAASAGLAQKDVTNKLADYGERLRPIAADLAKLSIEQEHVAQTAGKESAAYAEIGFKFGQAKKAISEIPPELAKVPTAADTASNSLLGAFKSTGLYGQSIERAQKFTAQFRTGLDVLKGGFKGMQAGEEAATEGSKVLKVGLAEIGIGLLILAFTTLVSYFTQSAEGAKILGGVTSALGATFQALTDIVTGTGKAIFQVLSGDFKGAGETVSKTFEGVGSKIANAAVQGYKVVAMEKELAKARRELEVEDVKEQSRVAVLLRLSKERGKTSAEQLAALKEAGEIEAKITQKNIDQQQKELDLINLKIKLKGSASKGDLLQQQADAQKAIAQSEATQKETNAKIQVRQSVFLEEQRQRGLDDNKAYYDARAAQAVKGTQAEVEARVGVLLAERQKQLGAIGLTENQRQAIVAASQRAIKEVRTEYTQRALAQIAALEQLALDRRILRVKAGSEEELDLQREKLTIQYNLETSQTGLTLRGKLILQQKYEADALKLEADSRKAAALAAYDAELATVNAELLAVRKGTTEETELRVEAINVVLAKELASLDKRADNTAKAALLRANAEKAANEVRYGAAAAATEAFIRGEKNRLDDHHANGLIGEKEYNRAVLASDTQAAAMRLQLAKTYGQETTALQQQLADKQRAIQQEVTNEEKAKYLERASAAQGFGKQVGQLIADSLFEQGATIQEFLGKILILVLDTVEQQLIAQQTASIASASIQSMSQLDSVATFGATGFARIAILTAAITTFFEIFKLGVGAVTAPPKQFAQGGIAYVGGGIAYGPSHAQGGIPLFYQGRPAGIEIEGGEPVLHRGVSQNPLLLSLASTVNQLAGGRALAAGLMSFPRLALGGIAKPLVMQQLRGGVGEGLDYARLAKELEKVKIYTRTSDTKAALGRDAFTQSQSNS